MDVKFKIYSYITPDHEPGTLIVHPDLSNPFDTQKLFEMDCLVVKEISLQDILEKGFIKIGSTDMMDDMDIEYPVIENERFKKNRIIGKHWSYTPNEVAEMIGKQFEVDNVMSANLDNSDDLVSFDSDSSDIDNIRSKLIQEHNNLESVLDDGKMTEIFDKIDDCEKTAVKDVDRLLSELEF